MPLLHRLGLGFSDEELERRYMAHAQGQLMRFDVVSTLVDVVLTATSLARDVAAGRTAYFVVAHLALALAYLGLLLARRDVVARRRSLLLALRRLSVALVVPYVLLPSVTAPAESWGALLRHFNAAGMTSLLIMSIQFRDVQFVVNAALNAATAIYLALSAAPHICSPALASTFSRGAIARLSSGLDALAAVALHGRWPDSVGSAGDSAADAAGAAGAVADATCGDSTYPCVPVLVTSQARAHLLLRSCSPPPDDAASAPAARSAPPDALLTTRSPQKLDVRRRWWASTSPTPSACRWSSARAAPSCAPFRRRRCRRRMRRPSASRTFWRACAKTSSPPWRWRR